MSGRPEPEQEGVLSEAVEAFLRANPGWLAEKPELYRVLVPPARVHGEAIADHMAAMIRAERLHSAEMSARADGILASGRAAAGLTQRVQEAVLALIHAADPAEYVAGEIPPILGVDSALLCLEDHLPHTRPLPSGTVQTILRGRDVVYRDNPDDAVLFHAEAARLACRDALIRVPWRGAPGLVSLVSRDPLMLDGSCSGALAFLGRAVGAALDRWA